ncbi:type II secretion system F family protein [Pseudalkalibacillus caeni]|uniref:Secretion system protein n=1 Tax=Exobacillus caeni TaxID=2574798 RepID=A0A5R9EYR0_9BACL|nr:type II secretion system F family protein [Pseudalkalibacillus caeni]TLS35579.1 secretion system protein [Pseudalkalibacillus caeni]
MLFVVSFVFLTMIFYFILSRFNGKKRAYLARVDKFLPKETSELPKPAVEKEPRKKQSEYRSFMHTVSKIAKVFRGKTFVVKWNQLLMEAGLPLKAEEFFVLRLLGMAAMAVVGYILGLHVILVFVLAVIGFMAPTIYLKNKKKKRLQKCAEQLPNTLGTMANAMKAGFSFLQAMQMVGKEMPSPLGPEFTSTVGEMNLGVPVEESLGNLLTRLPNEDLKLVVTSLIVQRSTGGNLAELLESIQETIRERVKIQEELKTLTAQGKISALVISLMPVILGFLLNMINPEYFSPLLSHPLGWAMLAAGCFSGIFGWIVIQKIVNVEV